MIQRKNATRLLTSLCMVWLSACATSDLPVAGNNLRTRVQVNDAALIDAPELPPPKILPETHFAAGHLFEAQGLVRKAIEQYQLATLTNHNYAAAYHRLGLLLSRIGMHDEALVALARAIELLPNDPTLRNNYGFSLLLADRLHEAEQELRIAIALSPDFVRAHINLGIVLSKLQRFDEAFAAFAAVLPDCEAHYNVGLMQRAQHMYAEAAESFRMALELDPNFEAAATQLAEIAPEPDPEVFVVDAAEVDVVTDAEEPVAEELQVAAEGTQALHVIEPDAEEMHAAAPGTEEIIVNTWQGLAVSAGRDQTVPASSLVYLCCEQIDGGAPATLVWTQTAGPNVELTDHGDGTASFIAPSDGRVRVSFECTGYRDDTLVTDAIDIGNGKHAPAHDTEALHVIEPGTEGIVVQQWHGLAVSAGRDQTVPASSLVHLRCEQIDGGAPAALGWTQTAGPKVNLTDHGDGTASFVAPPEGRVRVSFECTGHRGDALVTDTIDIGNGKQAPDQTEADNETFGEVGGHETMAKEVVTEEPAKPETAPDAFESIDENGDGQDVDFPNDTAMDAKPAGAADEADHGSASRGWSKLFGGFEQEDDADQPSVATTGDVPSLNAGPPAAGSEFVGPPNEPATLAATVKETAASTTDKATPALNPTPAKKGDPATTPDADPSSHDSQKGKKTSEQKPTAAEPTPGVVPYSDSFSGEPPFVAGMSASDDASYTYPTDSDQWQSPPSVASLVAQRDAAFVATAFAQFADGSIDGLGDDRPCVDDEDPWFEAIDGTWLPESRPPTANRTTMAARVMPDARRPARYRTVGRNVRFAATANRPIAPTRETSDMTAWNAQFGTIETLLAEVRDEIHCWEQEALEHRIAVGILNPPLPRGTTSMAMRIAPSVYGPTCSDENEAAFIPSGFAEPIESPATWIVKPMLSDVGPF